MQTIPKMPNWMKKSPTVVNKNKSSNFLAHNLAMLAHILAHFNQPKLIQHNLRSAWAELVNLFLLVLITVTAHNVFVLWLLSMIFLYNLLIMPVTHILLNIKKLVQLSTVSMLITLPSLMLTSPKVAGLWAIKIILVIGEVQIFRHRTTWVELITALKQFKVPGLFILTLDITVKYSHVLGQRLQETLQAIQLRSCGAPRHPLRLSGQILGQLYLVSREEAKQLYAAMLLRGYRENTGVARWKSQRQDWQLISVDLLIICFAVLGRNL